MLKSELSSEQIVEVINKLVGPINPIGESNTDSKRFENLELLCDVVNQLVTKIDKVSHDNRNAHESSIQKCATFAKEFLTKTLGISW